jgi:putative hydrolase of HD superfamily
MSEMTTPFFNASPRLAQQLAFIIEVDRLKSVMRRSRLISDERYENSAEHSWHLALMVLILAEYANEPVDLLRTIKMVLIHDIVEIDAGDTFAYDAVGALDKEAREQEAAARLFGLLPEDQAAELHELWQEFEARQTPEARMANAVDRMMPLMHNYFTRGGSWQRHEVTRPQVINRVGSIDDGSQELWRVAEALIDAAVDEGILAP